MKSVDGHGFGIQRRKFEMYGAGAIECTPSFMRAVRECERSPSWRGIVRWRIARGGRRVLRLELTERDRKALRAAVRGTMRGEARDQVSRFLREG